MGHLIIASAAGFETNEVMEKLRENGVRASQLIVGVGLVQSAIIASRLRDVVKDRDVVFCCTGGILGDFTGVDLYRAKDVVLRPNDVRHKQSYLVEGSEPPIELQSLPFSMPLCTVSGSPSISLSSEKSFGQIADIETLELYAVARAWFPWVKTLTGIVAVTNAVGAHAHEQWKSNFRNAASKTALAVTNEIIKLKDRWI
jgi:hypothetical protein